MPISGERTLGCRAATGAERGRLVGVRSIEISARLAGAWAERAGRDPATLLTEGSTTFQVREFDALLVVTSRVTGSSYEHVLPVSNEDLGHWLDEIVSFDVNNYKQRPA